MNPQRAIQNDSTAVAAALQAVYRGLNACSLYGVNHPAIHQAAVAAEGELAGALSGGQTILVGITAEEIVLGDVALTPADALTPIAGLFHRLDIAGIELRGELDAAGFESLSRELSRARAGTHKGVELAEQVGSATGGRVRLVPVDYTPLRLVEGAKQRGADDDSRSADWCALVTAITHGLGTGVGGGLMSPEALAAELNGQGLSGDAEQFEAIRGQLQRLAGGAGSSVSEEHQETLGKLRSFVGALKPDLRRSLMRVNPADPGGSFNLLGGLADSLPVSEVMAALETVDRESMRPTDEAMRLFQKMAGLCGRAEENRDSLAGFLKGWQEQREASGDDESADSLGGVLEELFQQRSTQEYSPQEYQSQLDNLSASARDGIGDGFETRMATENLRGHAAEIALEISGGGEDGDDDDFGPGMFRHLSGATDLLLQGERYGRLLAATRAAKERIDVAGEGASTHEARAWLDGLGGPGRVEAVLNRLCVEGVVNKDAAELLRLIGPAALPAVARYMAGGLPETARHAARRLLTANDDESLKRLVDGLVGQGADVLERVLPVIAELPPERCRSLVEPLLSDADVRTRRSAFGVLERGCSFWPARFLQAGLSDSDTGVQGIAVGQLARQKDSETMRLLGAFLEGRLDQNEPPAELYERVVDVLAGSGERGVELLCESLRSMSWCLRPRRAAYSRRLSRCLRRHAEGPSVRRAILYWRVSISRLVGLLHSNEPAKGGVRG